MELLHPGVYVQEVSSGVRPIEGVSTSTAAFIGPAERGPLDHAFMVTSFTEFETVYGGFMKDGWLAHSALQFFNMGPSDRSLMPVRPLKWHHITGATPASKRPGQISTATRLPEDNPAAIKRALWKGQQ